MNIYTQNLPRTFPFVIRARREFAQRIVKVLMESEHAPLGSSFAVTVNFDTGGVDIWLSQVSCGIIQTAFEGFDGIDGIYDSKMYLVRE